MEIKLKLKQLIFKWLKHVLNVFLGKLVVVFFFFLLNRNRKWITHFLFNTKSRLKFDLSALIFKLFYNSLFGIMYVKYENWFSSTSIEIWCDIFLVIERKYYWHPHDHLNIFFGQLKYNLSIVISIQNS